MICRFRHLMVPVIVFVALLGRPDPASADWSSSKTPQGQDILDHCRSALNEDYQMMVSQSRTLYPTQEENDRNHLGWFFTNWENLATSDISFWIKTFEKQMRDDPREWNHAVVCALNRRLYQLQNPKPLGGRSTAPPAGKDPRPPSDSPLFSRLAVTTIVSICITGVGASA